MHPHLATAFTHLEAATRGLRAAIDAVPVPMRAQSPAPGRWSVNEVVEHVAKVEDVFIQALVANIEAAARVGLAPEIADPPLLPEQTKAVLVDRTNRRMAPDAVVPGGQIDAMTSLRAIEDGHARLQGTAAAYDGLALSTVTHEHRFFGKLNVYQWIELLAGHEGRHTAQLREIATQVAGT